MTENHKARHFLTATVAGLLTAQASVAQPVNNDFSNRTPIIGANLTVSGTLSNATSEAEEPLIDGISSGQTAWWTWTAPSNGIVALAPDGAGFSPFLTVYTGIALADLSLLASNNYLACYSDTDCGCHWRMRDQISFHVARGQPYQICLDSPIITDASLVEQATTMTFYSFSLGETTSETNGQPVVATVYGFGPLFTTNVIPGGPAQLSLQFTPAPKNDEFTNATRLSGSRTHIAASNAGATKEPGEPAPLGNPGGSSVWYCWTAPSSGRVTLSTNSVAPFLPPSSQPIQWGTWGVTTTYIGGGPTCGDEVDQNPPPAFYPLLAAYTGTNVAALIAADCLPMALDAYPNAVEFDALKGQTYEIMFDGNLGTTGNITLFLALTTPAANDDFSKRIPLQGIYVAATGFNAGAPANTNAPAIGNGSTGKISWWTWTAPVSGTVSIDLSGSDYSFPIGIFSGSKLSDLQLIAANSGSVSFNATVGQPYQIAVGDSAGLTGEIKMTLQAPVIDARLIGASVLASNSALLRYRAVAGQVLLLQHLVGQTWVDVKTGNAHSNEVDFYVSAPMGENAANYRAVIVGFKPD